MAWLRRKGNQRSAFARGHTERQLFQPRFPPPPCGTFAGRGFISIGASSRAPEMLSGTSLGSYIDPELELVGLGKTGDAGG